MLPLQALCLSISFFYNFLWPARSQGQIFTWDLSVDFANANYAREFSIGFSLESGLSSSDYLKIYFPFSLHSTKTGDVPNGLKAELSFVGSTGCTPITALPANVFHKTDTTYYIQFLNEKGLPNRPLEKNTWYLIKLIITAAVIPQQTSSIKLPLAMKSVSAIDENAQVYDVNNAFGVFELVSSPNANLQATATISGDNKNFLDAIYTVILDITPQSEVKNYGRFLITMLDDSFKFNGASCSSVLKNITRYFANGTLENFTVIPALESYEYSCATDSAKNRVWININGTITPDKLYRFKISVRNPKNVVSLGGMKILLMEKHSNRIVELATLSSLFSTTALTWGTTNKNLKIYLGWGVDMSQTNLPDAFKFIRASSLADPTLFYNGIKFVFKPSFETPAGLELKLEINIPESTAGFAVLDGSISENLPRFISSYGSKPVVCSIDRTTPTNQKVICTGIGTLSNLSDYFVGIKAFLPYNAAQPDLSSSFGNIALYSFNTITNAYDATPIVAAGRNSAVRYKTANNLDWVPQSANNAFTAVHSQAIGANLAPITSSNFGIKTSKDEQNLVFTVKSVSNDIKGTGAQVNQAGFQIFTTKSIRETSVYNPVDTDTDGNQVLAEVLPAPSPPPTPAQE